jgi:hypothetical protein
LSQNSTFQLCDLTGAFTLMTPADDVNRWQPRRFQPQSLAKVDDVSQRQSSAKMELWIYARRHWRYLIAEVSWP